MNKVAVVTDSAVTILSELIQEYDIYVVRRRTGMGLLPVITTQYKELLLAELKFDWLYLAEESASVAVHNGRGCVSYAFCNKA